MAAPTSDAATLAAVLRGQGGRGGGSYLRQDPRFQAAQGLSAAGSDSSPTSLTGGIARLLSGALGGYLGRRAYDRDAAQRGEANQLLSSLLRGETPDLSQVGENPYAADLGQRYLESSLASQAQREQFDREAALRGTERAEDRAARQQQFEAEQGFRQQQLAAEQGYRESQLGLERQRLTLSGQQPRSLTEAQQRHQLAIAGGLEPGTAAYNDFILRGKLGEAGPDAFSNDARGKARAYLTDPRSDPGSPEYAINFKVATQDDIRQGPEGQIIRIAGDDPRNYRAPRFSGYGDVPAEATPSGPVATPAQQGSIPQPEPISAQGRPAEPFAGQGQFQPLGRGVEATRQRGNANENLAATFAERINRSNAPLEQFAPSATIGQRILSGVGDRLGTTGLNSPEYQQFRQARDELVNATLRRESGAAISAKEYEDADRRYIPLPGDSPEVLQQKRIARGALFQSLVNEAGPAGGRLLAPAAQSAAPVNQAPAIPQNTVKFIR